MSAVIMCNTHCVLVPIKAATPQPSNSSREDVVARIGGAGRLPTPLVGQPSGSSYMAPLLVQHK